MNRKKRKKSQIRQFILILDIFCINLSRLTRVKPFNIGTMPIIVCFIVDIVLKGPVSFITCLLWLITVRYQILFSINELLVAPTLLVMFHRLGFGLLLVVRKVLVFLLEEFVLLAMMMSLWRLFLLFSWVLLLLLVLFLFDLIHFFVYSFVFRLLLLHGSKSNLTFIDQKVLKNTARIAHEYLFMEFSVLIKLHF